MQSQWDLPQSVSESVPSSSTYDRSTSRPPDLHPMSRPAVRALCKPQPVPGSSPQMAARGAYSRHHVTGPTRPLKYVTGPSNNGRPSVSDWNGSLGSEYRSSSASNYPYDSCIADITRQQVDSIMAKCQRTQGSAAVPARNIRKKPTVV